MYLANLEIGALRVRVLFSWNWDIWGQIVISKLQSRKDSIKYRWYYSDINLLNPQSKVDIGHLLFHATSFPPPDLKRKMRILCNPLDIINMFSMKIYMAVCLPRTKNGRFCSHRKLPLRPLPRYQPLSCLSSRGRNLPNRSRIRAVVFYFS